MHHPHEAHKCVRRPKLLIFPRLSGRHGNYRRAGARIGAAAKPNSTSGLQIRAWKLPRWSISASGPTGIRASEGRFVQDQGAAKPRIQEFSSRAGDFIDFGLAGAALARVCSDLAA
jgi:hypothetical protein